MTSATLCDAVIAVDSATFCTPFERLGIPPEGCSTYHWPKILSAEDLHKMHKENHVATAGEALTMGLITEVTSSEKLLGAAQQLCEKWINEGKQRWLVEQGLVDEYEQVNLRESKHLADAIFGGRFMLAQTRFFFSKKKYTTGSMFLLMFLSRPFWAPLVHLPDRIVYALLIAFVLLIFVLVFLSR